MNDPLKVIEAVMDQLSPREQAEVIGDLITKYGVPRTFLVELMGWLGANTEQADAVLGEFLDRSNHLIPKENM